MNILEEANNIVFLRSEEKERQYGSFIEGMHKASQIASGMTGKEITTEDMFKCMVALKLSRESYNHKYDNLLDAIAYLAALNEYHNEHK
jgi:DNA-binding protein H-NS